MDDEPLEISVPTRLGPLHVHTIGSGPPALLWHSLFVDSTTWIRVQQPLSGMRQLIQIDGPAHGHNPPAPTRFTLHDCVGVAVDVMDHLSIQEPVDWLGNAWGGHVGVLFAAAHPDRVRSLTATGPPIHPPRPPAAPPGGGGGRSAGSAWPARSDPGPGPAADPEPAHHRRARSHVDR